MSSTASVRTLLLAGFWISGLSFSGLLIGGLLTNAAPLAAAQTAPQAVSRVEVAASFGANQSNVVAGSRFWMPGGVVQAHIRLDKGLGAVAEFSGFHTSNIQSTGVGLNLFNATFGVRYTLPTNRCPFRLYGQGLGGAVWGSNSYFPNGASVTNSVTGLAVEAGGGVELPLRRGLALRLIDAEWVRTNLPNAQNNAQNNLRLTAGVVFTFH